MLIPFTKLMVAAAPAASDVVVDAKATRPKALVEFAYPGGDGPGRRQQSARDPSAAALSRGAGRVEGPLSATATLTTAAITTTAQRSR